MVKAKAKPAKAAPRLGRHPLSEKFGPQMSTEELLGLGTDIKAHGQHDDIILYEGKILAGWNRYMGCLQQGVKPITKEMPKGTNPMAVAFGTNFVRRRLSSVQKAFYGAQFAIDSETKQQEVAKLVGCNLNRLNQCCQLLKTDTPQARVVVELLRTNPDVSSGTFDEKLLELGITRVGTATAPPAPGGHSNTFVDDDDDILGGDDDLTGGAIDDLLDEPADEEGKAPATRKTREVGADGVTPLPSAGSKPPSNKNPHETLVSRVSKAYRGMSAEDQQKFVKFAWGKLQPALNAAILAGDVKYTPPAEDDVLAPEPKKAAKVAAVKPTAKKATPAKKAAAKKATKK